MSESLKIIIASIVILLLFIGYFVFKQSENKPSREKEESAKLRTKALTQQMVKKYNADTTLHSKLDTISSFFSINIQRQFQENIGNPILIKGILKDIYIEEDSAFASFEIGFWGNVNMELALSEKQVESLNKDNNWYAEYAIVAEINRVSKPAITLRSRGINEYESEIEISDLDLIIIRGKCFDLLKIE